GDSRVRCQACGARRCTPKGRRSEGLAMLNSHRQLKRPLAMIVLWLTFLGLVMPFAGLAQTTSGKIVGYVYDTIGIGIADAIVSVVNETDRKTDSIRTDARGNYVLPNLAPG